MRIRCLCLIAVLALWFSGIVTPFARAQEFRGKVQGLITDSTGAVVSGATVALMNVKTAVRTLRVSNETGLYRFDNVDPGSYMIIVELPGFSKFVQENVEVQAQADITVGL